MKATRPIYHRLTGYAIFALLALAVFPAILVNTAEAQAPGIAFAKSAYTVGEDEIVGVRVNLSHTTKTEVAFDLVTTDGTATSADYIGGTFPSRIPAGRDFLILPILTRADNLVEVDETFTVGIRLPAGSPHSAGSDTTVTIQDSTQVISFAETAYSVD